MAAGTGKTKKNTAGAATENERQENSARFSALDQYLFGQATHYD